MVMRRVRPTADTPRRAATKSRQNFPIPEAAERFVSNAGVDPGELIVDVGAGSGALSRELLRRGAQVIAVEADPAWAARLADLARMEGRGRLRGSQRRLSRLAPPPPPLPGGGLCALRGHHRHPAPATRRPRPVPNPRRSDHAMGGGPQRAAAPPTTLLSTTWAPSWEFPPGRRIPATGFRPVPRVDGGVLVITQ